MSTKQSQFGFIGCDRKAVLYEVATLLDELAERHKISYVERDEIRCCAKILRKEGREPGSLKEWLAIDRPTVGYVK